MFNPLLWVRDIRLNLGHILLDDKGNVGYEAMLLHRVCTDCNRTIYQILRDHRERLHPSEEKEYPMMSDNEIEEIYDHEEWAGHAGS
jgi:hypothetical protein